LPLQDQRGAGQALPILRGLVERIVISPSDQGTGETIELVGAIARMVALGNKKAALDARTACSVKMVAGPTTTDSSPYRRLLSEVVKYGLRHLEARSNVRNR
jgi:hypothetical protein